MNSHTPPPSPSQSRNRRQLHWPAREHSLIVLVLGSGQNSSSGRGFAGLYQTSQLWSTRKSPTEQVLRQLENSHINNFAFLSFPISAGVSNIDKCQPYSLFSGFNRGQSQECLFGFGLLTAIMGYFIS